VLDEATSNLDQPTERRIVETLATLRGEVTMVIVTHRVRTVAHCDRVLYLEAGEVAACGSFAEVQSLIAALAEPAPSLTIAAA